MKSILLNLLGYICLAAFIWFCIWCVVHHAVGLFMVAAVIMLGYVILMDR